MVRTMKNNEENNMWVSGGALVYNSVYTMSAVWWPAVSTHFNPLSIFLIIIRTRQGCSHGLSRADVFYADKLLDRHVLRAYYVSSISSIFFLFFSSFTRYFPETISTSHLWQRPRTAQCVYLGTAYVKTIQQGHSIIIIMISAVYIYITYCIVVYIIMFCACVIIKLIRPTRLCNCRMV
jgi:hypothetical protein